MADGEGVPVGLAEGDALPLPDPPLPDPPLPDPPPLPGVDCEFHWLIRLRKASSIGWLNAKITVAITAAIATTSNAYSMLEAPRDLDRPRALVFARGPATRSL